MKFCLGALALCCAQGVAAAPYDVGRYESTGLGPVNSWWIETPGGGLIVVDAQRDAVQARAAVEAIRMANKPVRAIFITHPHPDHIGGLGVYKAAFPDARIHAQAATRVEIVSDTQKLLSGEGNERLPLPDIVLHEEARLEIDGVLLEARQFGAGESVGMTVYWLPAARLLVSGDLATPGLVPFLHEGRTEAWLAQLAAVKRAYPATARLLPGHGPAAPLAALVDAQAAYLRTYRSWPKRWPRKATWERSFRTRSVRAS